MIERLGVYPPCSTWTLVALLSPWLPVLREQRVCGVKKCYSKPLSPSQHSKRQPNILQFPAPKPTRSNPNIWFRLACGYKSIHGQNHNNIRVRLACGYQSIQELHLPGNQVVLRRSHCLPHGSEASQAPKTLLHQPSRPCSPRVHQESRSWPMNCRDAALGSVAPAFTVAPGFPLPPLFRHYHFNLNAPYLIIFHHDIVAPHFKQ